MGDNSGIFMTSFWSIWLQNLLGLLNLNVPETLENKGYSVLYLPSIPPPDLF